MLLLLGKCRRHVVPQRLNHRLFKQCAHVLEILLLLDLILLFVKPLCNARYWSLVSAKLLSGPHIAPLRGSKGMFF